MKKQIKREEVAKLLVTDKYFEKGNSPLKIWQTIIALLGWLAVIAPFIWVFAPLIFKDFAQKYQLKSYADEIRELYSLDTFLTIIFFIILILYISLTLWNNHRFKHFLQKKALYDEKRVEHRKEVLEKEFTKRFGPKEERENVRFYSVKEEQNFDKDDINELYKKDGDKL